jgi:hypothetical protein
MFKINLAPIRYAHIHRDHGGPIASISFRESTRLGEYVFEAFASLDKAATGMPVNDSRLCGDSDGSGAGSSKAEAMYRAVSKALARWAWHSSLEAGRPGLGLNLDSSATGFAAFPGLGARSARSNALAEAVESWSLGMWWQGALPHRLLEPLRWESVNGLEIVSPGLSLSAVVLWKEGPVGRAYGFAAGKTREAAAKKAAMKLGRNIHALEYAESKRGTEAGVAGSRNERRLLFFAGENGRAAFDARLRMDSRAGSRAGSRTGGKAQRIQPKLVVDCPVPGPWGKYAHVWRCLLDPSELHDTGADDYFHF